MNFVVYTLYVEREFKSRVFSSFLRFFHISKKVQTSIGIFDCGNVFDIWPLLCFCIIRIHVYLMNSR